MKEFDTILRSNSGYVNCSSNKNLVYIQIDFHPGTLKLFDGNFRQGIKLHIIYFSLTDINIRTGNFIFNSFALYTHTQEFV